MDKVVVKLSGPHCGRVGSCILKGPNDVVIVKFGSDESCKFAGRDLDRIFSCKKGDVVNTVFGLVTIVSCEEEKWHVQREDNSMGYIFREEIISVVHSGLSAVHISSNGIFLREFDDTVVATVYVADRELIMSLGTCSLTANELVSLAMALRRVRKLPF